MCKNMGKRVIIAGVAWLVLLAVLLTDCGVVQGQELEPRLWLPVIHKAPSHGLWTVELRPSMCVVEPDMMFTVEMWAENIRTDAWAVDYWWEWPVKAIGGFYEDGLWVANERHDATPVWGIHKIHLEQSGPFATADKAHLATFPMLCKGTKDSWVWLDMQLGVDGKRYVTQSIIYAVPCVGEFTDDGVRDVGDIAAIRACVGCEYGDDCFDPLMDFDCDLAVTDKDVAIASLYWQVPCP